MGNYDDIINLPHHTSQRHPRMSMYNRAAQFSPFAALTGYEKAIEEARKKQEAEVRRRDAPVELWERKDINYLNDIVCNLHCISNSYLKVSVLLSSAFLQESKTVANFATVNKRKVNNILEHYERG